MKITASVFGGHGTSSRGKQDEVVVLFFDFLLATLILLLLLPGTQSFAVIIMSSVNHNQQQQQQQHYDDSGGDKQHPFAFVESRIGKILELEDDGEVTARQPRLSVDETSLCLLLASRDTVLSVTDLVPLARQCDQLIFEEHGDCNGNTSNCPQCQDDRLQALRQDALIRLVRGNKQHLKEEEEELTTDAGCWVLMSTLLALNTLESSIRQATGSPTAKAPLLTIMLQKLLQQQQQQQQQPHTMVLIQVLQLVLLPTGLNLRNMLWHGFIGQELPRPWLALVVYLIYQVRHTWNTTTDKSTISLIPQEKQQLPLGLRHLSNVHPRMERIVKQGSQIRQSIIITTTTTTRQTSTRHPAAIHNISLWLPSEHRLLWQFVCRLMAEKDDKKCPWICIALLLLLLEHGLRLDWCRVNNDNKEKDTKAVSGKFYVTLDGHGQKHKHNLLLHPFVYDDASFVVDSDSSLQSLSNASITTTTTTRTSAHRNKLIPLIGAETMALLTDLLMSPAEDGPNVRAALSHGLLDECLDQEILYLLTSTGTSNNGTGLLDEMRMSTALMTSSCDENHAWEIVDALLVALDSIAADNHIDTSSPYDHESGISEILRQYRPIFSYTAITAQRLQALDGQLQRFHETVVHHSNLIDKCKGALLVPESILKSFSFPYSQLEHEMKLVLDFLLMSSVDREWTIDLVYTEHATNQRLAPLGATQLLLSELNRALSPYLDEFAGALAEPNELKKRAQHRRTRIIATGPIAFQFFLFAAYVSLISLHRGLDPRENALDDFTAAEILHATKRTRMAVSTVETFLLVNADRAFKAMDEYRKGKIVKRILQDSCK